ASGSRDSERAAGSFVRLLEGDAARVDVHADALVERDRAGRVLGVDVERDPPRAAAPELGERRLEQRLAEPLAAPRGPDADRADVSAAGDVRIVARDGGELVSVPDDEPDGPVLVAVLAPAALEPLVERVRMPLPVLRERLVQRVVERLVLVLVQLVQDEPFREGGCRRL